jgi:hypothetical protein
VVYRGTEFAEAVREAPDKSVYWVERTSDGKAVETMLDTRTVN